MLFNNQIIKAIDIEVFSPAKGTGYEIELALITERRYSGGADIEELEFNFYPDFELNGLNRIEIFYENCECDEFQLFLTKEGLEEIEEIIASVEQGELFNCMQYIADEYEESLRNDFDPTDFSVATK